MKKNPTSQSGIFYPRAILAFAFCAVGFFLTALGFASTPTPAGWSLITSPNPSATNNLLSSITCVSANDCWAIGGGDIAVHWNGTSWSAVPMPTASGAVLNSVACSSSSECWAVGYYSTGGIFQTLIERWDGTGWSIVASPNTSVTQGNYLYGVACASSSECWAVGHGNFQTLIERWDGFSWTIVTSPNHGTAGNVLNGVACAGASDCWAVGSWNDGETGDSLIEHWNGTSWSISASPYTGIAYNSVACASTSECWAVTGNGDEFGPALLIAQWNGTAWAIVPTPAPSPNPDNSHALFSVTCASASQCWAVGFYNNGVAARTLIEKWDGASWSIIASPNNGTLANYLYGATCASASQCWAVGYYVNGNRQTLIEEFSPTIPPLTSIGSRKVHGSTPFDIDLLNGSPGIECRSPGTTGTLGVDYKIVFGFVNNVASCGSASTGSLSSGPNLNQCTVDLTGVANQQYVTVTLNSVLDSQNNTGNVPATMGVLIGDTSSNKSVNASDVSQTKSKSGQAVSAANFRTDVNISNSINSSDVSTVKAKSGTALP
jgi:hypothetical protein